MAKTSMKVKQQRPAKFSTREYTLCRFRIFLKQNVDDHKFCNVCILW